MSLGTCSVNSFAVCFQNWKLKGTESPWDNTWPMENESWWRKTTPFHLLGGKLLAPPLHLPLKRLPWVELHLLTATSFIMCFYLAFCIFLFHFPTFLGSFYTTNCIWVSRYLGPCFLGKPRLRYPLICLPLLFLLIESSLSWKPQQFLWKHWSNYTTSPMTSHLMQSKNRSSLIWPPLIYPTLSTSLSSIGHLRLVSLASLHLLEYAGHTSTEQALNLLSPFPPATWMAHCLHLLQVLTHMSPSRKVVYPYRPI